MNGHSLVFGAVPAALYAAGLALFGDTTPGEAAATTGGIAGFGSLGLSGYLIWKNSSDIRELRASHEREMATARTEYIEKYSVLANQFLSEVQEFRREVREARREQQQNIERYLEHSKDMVATLEKFSQGQKDLHEGQAAMQRALNAIENRMALLEGREPPTPVNPVPGAPAPGDPRHRRK